MKRVGLLSKRKLAIIVIGVVLVAIGIYGADQWQSNHRNIQVPGESEVFRARVTALESEPPAEKAPLDVKLSYYDKLVQAKRISGDHAGSVEAFQTREKLSPKDLDYLDYLHLADSYSVLMQKQPALDALTQCEKLLPADNPTEGFYRSEIEDDITRIRDLLQP